jgi:hypothetical protein
MSETKSWWERNAQNKGGGSDPGAFYAGTYTAAVQQAAQNSDSRTGEVHDPGPSGPGTGYPFGGGPATT